MVAIHLSCSPGGCTRSRPGTPAKPVGPVARPPDDSLLLLRHRDSDVAVTDHTVVIALQIERSRLSLIAVESAAGRPRKLYVVVVHLAIAQHRHMPADQRDVVARPLAKVILGARRRRIPAVD